MTRIEHYGIRAVFDWHTWRAVWRQVRGRCPRCGVRPHHDRQECLMREDQPTAGPVQDETGTNIGYWELAS